jgi:hypothetical protein
MKILYTAFIAVLMSQLTCYSQSSYGMKVNPGISRIYGHVGSTYLNKETYSFKPSVQAGVFYTYSRNRTLIGGEILFLQIEGQGNLEWNDVAFPGITYSTSKSVYNTNISYIGIPIYYGYSFKRLNLNLGFQANILISNSGTVTSTIKDYSGGPSLVVTDKTNDLLINRLDYGPRAGIFFTLNKSFSLEANYYHGLSNILQQSSGWIWRTQQFTIGVRYVIYSPYKETKD